MTPEQERHLQSIKVEFEQAMDRKYRAGARERGEDGCLADVDERRLVDHALEEVLDQFAYLTTLRQKMRTDKAAHLVELMDLVDREVFSAVSSHHTFPTDLCRAITILGEEYGEVCREALELGRIDRDMEGKDEIEKEAAKANHRYNLKRELVQLMAASAMCVMFTLEKERPND